MSNQTLKTTPQIGGGYSHYVLAILMLVYAFNFIDRNILTILAEDIKADLGISDGELGFLYGTVFCRVLCRGQAFRSHDLPTFGRGAA